MARTPRRRVPCGVCRRPIAVHSTGRLYAHSCSHTELDRPRRRPSRQLPLDEVIPPEPTTGLLDVRYIDTEHRPMRTVELPPYAEEVAG